MATASPTAAFPARRQGGPLPSWDASGVDPPAVEGRVYARFRPDYKPITLTRSSTGTTVFSPTGSTTSPKGIWAINGGAPSWAAIRPRVARRLADHVTVMRPDTALMFTAGIL